ncbi:hypothetical protein RDWZM_007683 [Blomia tropicalis]|uniref:DUF3456 domain-containing protein n=1 Tax=Blomia tropicalis TaxID=40697 RepID=A0A9Q0M072_BLOTA|nr:hypothetical protein RDWZM_007683 [Blomia tropicalis]
MIYIPLDRLLCQLYNPIIFILIVCSATPSLSTTSKPSIEEEVYGVKYASDCEVCKLLVTELQDRLDSTGKSHDVIETGYTFDSEKRTKTKYQTSELRLIDSMDGICDTLLEYNIHKERTDSTRFAKGMSTTFKTLHGLVGKGVKVDLGIPYELWDKPSAEVTYLKSQCEKMIEQHESDIENWYFHHQPDQSLGKYLCEDRVLRRGDAGCLTEVVEEATNNSDDSKTKISKNEL